MSRRPRPLGYRRSLHDYDDYDDYDLFTPAALVVTPMVVTPVVPIWFTFSPAWYGVMSWMNPAVFEIWRQWQDNIRGENYTTEQRKRLLMKALQRENENDPLCPFPPRYVEQLADRIIAMEPELGADQFGHVNTAAANPPGQSAITASSSTSTTMTTTTVTQQQRQDAGQLYLQSLNGTNTDRQQAEQTYQKIISGQSDPVVEHILQTKQSNAAQHSIPQQRQLSPAQTQPLQIEAPPAQQQQRQQRQSYQQQNYQQQQSQPQQIQSPQNQQQQQQQIQPLQIPEHMSATQQYAQQQHAQQQTAFQQMLMPHPMQNTVQPGPQQAYGHGQPQSPSQQFHSTITTTTMTSTNTSNMYGQQMPQGYQQPMQNPQPMQQMTYQAQQQIGPGTPGPLNQQPQITWANQGNQPSPQQAGQQQQGYFPPAPQSERPAIGSRLSSSKEQRQAEREARKASRSAKK